MTIKILDTKGLRCPIPVLKADKIVKNLKTGDILKISGHMLRKGMMGSDVSYEDMLDKTTQSIQEIINNAEKEKNIQ